MNERINIAESRGTVLVDCDGVLVENTAFERRVTKTLIEELATTRQISMAAADALWSEELSATRGHWQWYDYSYHCDRLALKSPEVVHQSHIKAAHLLSEVPGARETIDALKASNYVVGVTTDATEWVVRYKLGRLGITIDGPIFTSDSLQSTKARKRYWLEVRKFCGNATPRVLIDNRAENLSASQEVLGLQPIRFLRHEHVTTLSRTVAPIGSPTKKLDHTPVSDHEQLRNVLHEVLPRFHLCA